VVFTLFFALSERSSGFTLCGSKPPPCFCYVKASVKSSHFCKAKVRKKRVQKRKLGDLPGTKLTSVRVSRGKPSKLFGDFVTLGVRALRTVPVITLVFTKPEQSLKRLVPRPKKAKFGNLLLRIKLTFLKLSSIYRTAGRASSIPRRAAKIPVIRAAKRATKIWLSVIIL